MLTLFVDESPETSCQRLVEHLVSQWQAGSPLKLGGATGRTFRKVYPMLLSHSSVGQRIPELRIWFLDEYFGHAIYHAYAHSHLKTYEPGGFAPEHVHVPRGVFFDERDQIIGNAKLESILQETKGEWEAHAEEGSDGFKPEIRILSSATHPVLKQIRDANQFYDNQARTNGADRIQFLGLGVEGHIGFNEQGGSLDGDVALVKLASSTRAANEGDFELTDGDGLPTRLEPARFAITQGIGTILSARELVLAAHGKSKVQATEQMLLSEPSPACPASAIQKHSNASIFLDRQAFGNLEIEKLQERGYRIELSSAVKTAN